jgi:hypothetical protein
MEAICSSETPVLTRATVHPLSMIRHSLHCAIIPLDITYDIPNASGCSSVGVHLTLSFRVRVRVMFGVQAPRCVSEWIFLYCAPSATDDVGRLTLYRALAYMKVTVERGANVRTYLK